MSIEEVKFYMVTCDGDGCRESPAPIRLEARHMRDAVNLLKKMGWKTGDGGTVCPACARRGSNVAVESAR